MKSSGAVFEKLKSGHVLVIHRQRPIQASLKSAIRSLGGEVQCVSNYRDGLLQIELRNFSYVFIESTGANPEATEFAAKALKRNPDSILICLFEPAYVDQFFDMLQLGVRGFLVVPCNLETVEEAMIGASGGIKIPEEFKVKGDRNEAFVSLVVKHLDLVSRTLKEHREAKSGSWSNVLKAHENAFHESVGLAKRFFDGGADKFRDSLMKACIDNSEMRNRTRLGSLRKKLALQRTAK